MRFFFNPRKAGQAAAYLIQADGGKKNLMALIKLLYLSDRAALLESGAPITGDRMISMPHGPVLSRIYDSAAAGWRSFDAWYDYVSERESHDVVLAHPNPERGELSDYEIGVLEAIHQGYGHLDQWELRRLTHNLPEYEDPSGSSLPIDPVTILRSAGKSNAEIEQLSSLSEEVFFLESLKERL